MRPRDPAEPHRASTPLELLFDLVFVVAVATAAERLGHAAIGGHLASGARSYQLVFFAIWWGWLNFTWFASAYDTDDVPYRVTTLLQMAGALVVAAGVTRAVDDGDFTVITAGYVIMRFAMVLQWLRASRAAPDHRATALRYAAGIAVVQCAWVARLALPEGAQLAAFLVLVVAEVSVPAWAERTGVTSYHRSHIAERYGLFL
ncbi:low temperature requirement protein A, partial [Enterococcus hirae]|nr:low temperature requirement protein A [Enterococcus hirae]